MRDFLGLYQKNSVLCVFDLKNKTNKYMTVEKIMQQNYDNAINLFFTPNALGYRRKDEKTSIRRDNEHLQTFEALYCDLDFKLSDYDCNEDEVIESLLEYWEDEDCELIEPTMITFSGHGLHLYWKIESISYRGNIEKWELCQEYIYNSLRKWGADKAITKDKVRVLRVPNTINKKADCEPIKCEIKAFSGKVYTLDSVVEKFDLWQDLRRIYNNKYKNNVLQFKREQRRTKKNKGKSKGVFYTNFNQNADKTYTRLFNARLKDLEKLALSRTEGTRELIMFLYQNYMMLATGNKEFTQQKALELNSRTQRPLTEREVIKVAQARKNYKYSTETIIELLGITEQEMIELELCSLVTPEIRADRRKEQNKRYYERRAGQSKAEQIEERRTKLAILLEQGKTEQEILEILQISRRTNFADKKVVCSTEWVEQNQEPIQKAIEQEKTGQVELVLLEQVAEYEKRKLQRVYEAVKHYQEPIRERRLKVPI